jgi:hypothetical protein
LCLDALVRARLQEFPSIPDVDGHLAEESVLRLETKPASDLPKKMDLSLQVRFGDTHIRSLEDGALLFQLHYIL